MRLQSITTSMLLCFVVQGHGGQIQSWLNLKASQNFDYGLRAELETEQWFSTEDPIYRHLEIVPTLTWRYSPRYDFGIGYEYSRNYLPDPMGGNEMLEQEHTGIIFATIKVPLQRFSISSRQRFQIGDGEGEFIALFRQKNRVQYDGPWLLPVAPFLEDEWFFNLPDGYLMENRAKVGFMYQFNKAFSVEIYGMRLDRWDAFGNDDDYPVAGIECSWAF